VTFICESPHSARANLSINMQICALQISRSKCNFTHLVGEGSRMVRELFVMAREHAPSIIFMDEIDR
jgi:ATP-dependent 26S proteasome regulatory subunit